MLNRLQAACAAVFVGVLAIVVASEPAGSQNVNATTVGGCVYASPQPTVSTGGIVRLQCDQNGNLKTSGTGGGSVTVSNFPATYPGTSPLSASPQAAGSSNAWIAACQYNLSAPTLTNTQVAAQQCDASGNHLVNLNTALPAGTNNIGKTTGVFPYGASYTQSTTSGSFLGVGGYNGTTFNPMFADQYGIGKTQVCDTEFSTSTNCLTIYTPQADGTNITGGVQTTSATFVFNGNGSYDRLLACTQNVSINISSATTTQIVALASSKIIHVCAYQFSITGTTPSYQFEYGTGTTCGTGTTTLSGAIAPLTGTLVNSPFGENGVLRTPASQALCIVSGGTTPSIQGYISYAQY